MLIMLNIMVIVSYIILLAILLSQLKFAFLCLVLVTRLEMMLRFRKTSLHVEQNNHFEKFSKSIVPYGMQTRLPLVVIRHSINLLDTAETGSYNYAPIMRETRQLRWHTAHAPEGS